MSIDNQENPTPTDTPPATPPADNTTLGGGSDVPATTPPADQPPPDTPAPFNADDYKVERDGFDFENFKTENGDFLKAAHELGINPKQMEFLIGTQIDKISGQIERLFETHSGATTANLQKEWGDKFTENVGYAKKAALAAGITQEQLEDPRIGSNEQFIKLAAYFGSQLHEDTPPSNTQPNSSESIQQLLASEAYSNADHPDHRTVASKVNDFYAKNHRD
ncbi:hypothetical protein AWW72_13300 [Acinetobacter sp. NRRL B-65365]|uniref:hypothetical protein n=1 Tax=Acinetobacter sp. NRRL B-65365 TaxID=1785092 RepID=UPI0007A05036|nr:hypothetical protein [Acinetobacter sp. NRRL B-65365]KYQ83559.1 hypothetical protein AWW72_13300 [Acinetobacter sp. NRRL B-65365]